LTLVVGAAVLILAFVFGQDTAAQWLVSIYGAVMALLMLVEMIQTLREGRYGVDILAITAIGATIAVGQYWAMLVIIVMLTGGETLEDFAGSRAQRELKALLDRAPQIAHLVRDGKISDVKVSIVKPGDILLVKPHETVPVDSVLVSDAAEFDESSLTGESLPVEKKTGDSIMSGSLNGNAAVQIRATADAKHSQYEQIIALVREAESQPAPFVRLADRYAVPFTLISYIIAGTAWVISGNPARFAEVLVVASPCPLILAAPIALISGMSRASKHGIIVKNGAVLEKMNKVTVMAFDKTGTLTEGELVVDHIDVVDGASEDKLLSLAASAEINSSHILAKSLIEFAGVKKIKLHAAKNIREIAGDGVFANIAGDRLVLGRIDFLRQNKIKNLPIDSHADCAASIFVAVNGQFIGHIAFADKIRRDAKQTLHELKQLGIRETVMLTGDRQIIAQKIGKKAGVDKVFAELLPKDKVKIMRELDRDHDIAMVGDGVNDAPVLALADVGIAMGARGSTAASESADAVIMLDDLSRVALLRKISRRTIRVALQSVWSGIALCIVLMIIASFGFIPAVIGAGLQELIDVTVIFNALRAHKN